MEGGALYFASCDSYRLENGVGGCAPRAPHADDNVEKLCRDLLWWVLIRNSPARRPGGGSEFALQGKLVDFDDHAINFVHNAVPMGRVVGNEVVNPGVRIHDLGGLRHRHPPTAE